MKVYVLHFKGATKPIRFSSKKSFEKFVDMLNSLDKVSVEVMDYAEERGN